MSTGKCPSSNCGKVVGTLLLEEIEILDPITQKRFRGINLLCQSCRTIISSMVNPWMLKEEIVAGIADQR
jgi:hypothetical protein